MRLQLKLLGLFVALALPAQAIDFIATNVYAVGKDTVVSDEQWVLAGIAETAGTFKNDVFIMTGNPLKLSGTFEGNIWGAASVEAKLSGECLRNVRLSGKTVIIDGKVGGNVLALADTIIISTNACIHGDVRLIATSVIQEGVIEGNAHLSSARIATLGGRIHGNAKVTSPDILLSRDTVIGGDFNYTTGKELFPEEGVVGGSLNRIQPKAEPLFSSSRLTSKAMWFLAAMLAGIPFITLFPMTTAMSTHLIKRSPWKCLFVGFLASGALPMFGIMCISSVIGVPLGALILASWGVLFYISRIVMGLVIGTLILGKAGTSIGKVLAAMAIGLAAIYLASVFPAIGLPVNIMVLWLGMGSLIIALLEKRKLILQVPQNLKKLEELRDEQYNPEEK